MIDDLERLRLSDADFGLDLASRLQSEDGRVPAVVCLVSTDGSFPAAAGRFYKVVPQVVLGTETEGSSATFSSASGGFYAYNLGATIPTNGTTKVVCSFVPHRWVFEY